MMANNIPPYRKKERVILKHNGRYGIIKRCIKSKKPADKSWYADIVWDNNGGIITMGINANVIKPVEKSKSNGKNG